MLMVKGFSWGLISLRTLPHPPSGGASSHGGRGERGYHGNRGPFLHCVSGCRWSCNPGLWMRAWNPAFPPPSRIPRSGPSRIIETRQVARFPFGAFVSRCSRRLSAKNSPEMPKTDSALTFHTQLAGGHSDPESCSMIVAFLVLKHLALLGVPPCPHISWNKWEL